MIWANLGGGVLYVHPKIMQKKRGGGRREHAQ